MVTTTMHNRTGRTCQCCGGALGKTFVDGRLRIGPWAVMCRSCHRDLGVGLGIGRGQLYNTETGERVDVRRKEVA